MIKQAAAAMIAALTMTQAATAGTPLPSADAAPSGDAAIASPIPTESDWQGVEQTGYRLGKSYGLPAAPEGHVAQPNVPIRGYGPVVPGNYARPTAPLYPAPVHYTPPHNGGAIITNQALAPHEMLYPHEYNAMYGPFYYTVKGGFIWTPLGMRTHEKWQLQGTRVNVKYHDKIKLFSGFHPFNGFGHGMPSL